MAPPLIRCGFCIAFAVVGFSSFGDRFEGKIVTVKQYPIRMGARGSLAGFLDLDVAALLFHPSGDVKPFQRVLQGCAGTVDFLSLIHI